MASKSQYITDNSIKLEKRGKNKSPFFKMVIAFSLLFVSVLGIFSTVAITTNSSSESYTADANLYKWFMCSWDEDSAPRMMYLYTETDRLWFELQSKSYIGNGYDQVDNSFYNSVLNFTREGPEFGEVNRWVFDTQSDEDDYNFTGSVSPYDRFGLSGLQWSMYGGEWNYLHFDPCEDEDVTELDMGLFYNGRITPLSTWDDISVSEDVRTSHFQNGPIHRFAIAFVNVIANWIFNIAKFIVTITISIVSLAFGDIISLLGIDDFMWGEGNTGDGIVGSLYQGIFLPLSVLAFVITGGYIFYYGIIKRQYRTALVSGLGRSILLFAIGIIIFTNPATFVSLPNNIAVFVQSVIFAGSTVGTAGGDGLCESEVSQFGTGDIIPDDFDTNFNDPDNNVGVMEQVGVNTSSAIGCMFWQHLLFEPWARGQFGESWKDLFVDGEEIDGDHNGISYENADWTGDFAVPMGPEEDDIIHNFALFHVSTQTDAHYDQQAEMIGQFQDYSGGVHGDWWRIADALSNYDIIENQTSLVEATNVLDGAPDQEIQTNEPANHATTDQWEYWIGSHTWSRVFTAVTAVLGAIVGSIAPLIFAILAAAYAIGLAILMGFAPVFLLLGCWPGRGYELFKQWLELTLNTMMKRIGIAFIFVLVLVFTFTALEMFSTLGFLQATATLVIGTFLIISNRSKFVKMFEFFRFGNGGMQSISDRVVNKSKQAAAFSTRTASKMAAGGVASARYRNTGSVSDTGKNVFKGMGSGLTESLRHSTYRSNSQFAKSAMSQWQQENMANKGELTGAFDQDLEKNPICPVCHQVIDGGQAFIDDMGRYFHYICAEQHDYEGSKFNFVDRYVQMSTVNEREQQRYENRTGRNESTVAPRNRIDDTKNEMFVGRGYDTRDETIEPVSSLDDITIDDANNNNSPDSQYFIKIDEAKFNEAYKPNKTDEEKDIQHFVNVDEKNAYAQAGREVAVSGMDSMYENFEVLRRNARLEREKSNDVLTRDESRRKAYNYGKKDLYSVPEELEPYMTDTKYDWLEGVYIRGDWDNIAAEMMKMWEQWYRENRENDEEDVLKLKEDVAQATWERDMYEERLRNIERIRENENPL